MKIALAQINPIVGDLPGNVRKALSFARQASDAGADVVVFPEMSVTGYPPHDLLSSESFLDAVEEAVDRIATEAPQGLAIILGAPVRNRTPVGKRLFNAALLLAGGRVAGEARKSLLPTYDVYDEYRYFEPAVERSCLEWMGLRLGVHVCEDMWNMEEGTAFRMYAGNPLEDLVRDGADVLISLSATPYARGKRAQRTRLIETICRTFALPLVMANQVGANTELVFDGDSRIHGPDGRPIAAAPCFREALLVWDLETGRVLTPDADRLSTAAEDGSPVDVSFDGTRDLHDALVLGIGDYFEKSGAFTGAVVGLSGGIDSAVTCALAVEALGPERVLGVTMPSVYSSEGSIRDSEALARNLDIRFDRIPIQRAFDVYRALLEPRFAGASRESAERSGASSGNAEAAGVGPDTTEENLQARARAMLLMALSNKFGYLLLSTGNKSELAVGYSTLYGDMAGGLGVLSDVFKTDVYTLADFINHRAGREVIPRNSIEKAPSAELRPGQKDQDTLPPYDVLDSILRLYVEEQLGADAIVERTGSDRALVLDILGMVDRNEYKRRQAPPGLRVSPKAFGSGRVMPLVARYRPTFEPARST